MCVCVCVCVCARARVLATCTCVCTAHPTGYPVIHWLHQITHREEPAQGGDHQLISPPQLTFIHSTHSILSLSILPTPSPRSLHPLLSTPQPLHALHSIHSILSHSTPCSLHPLLSTSQPPHALHFTHSLLLNRSKEVKSWFQLLLWVGCLHGGAHHGQEEAFGGHVVRVGHARNVDVW